MSERKTIDQNRGKVELNGKLLRRNSPFIPYSIRIEILEYIEFLSQRNSSLYEHFGYFISDKTRKIFQVFRCLLLANVPNDDYNLIPTVNTIAIRFLPLVIHDSLLKRKFSKFQSLRTFEFSCGMLDENILKAVSKIPKLMCLKLEEDETNGVVGVEDIIENSHGKLLSIGIYINYFENTSKPLDYFERRIHLVRDVDIENYTIKGNYSSLCEVQNRSVFLSMCKIDISFLQTLGKNTQKRNELALQLRKCEIGSLEALFNENRLLSISSYNGVILGEKCNFISNKSPGNEKKELPGFSFIAENGNLELYIFSGCFKKIRNCKDYIVFTDEMMDLLNSFQKLFRINVFGRFEMEELLKIKNSNLRVIEILYQKEFDCVKLEMETLKENNPNLREIVCKKCPDETIEFDDKK